MMFLEIITPELSYIATTSVALFVIVDPFAVIPIYLSLTDSFNKQKKISIRRKSSIIAFIILTAFSISGMAIFNLFSITIDAFRIAGGILLLKFGIDQLSGNRSRVDDEEQQEAEESDDISVFPLATPLLAGPAAISTVVLYASKAESNVRVLSLVIAIAGALMASYVLLKYASIASRILGKTGLNVLTKIMGLILSAVAVQFILSGLKSAFNL